MLESQSQSTDVCDFNSRHAASNPPQLVISGP
jgi:hypothetical protein